jgi:hypothetical protein
VELPTRTKVGDGCVSVSIGRRGLCIGLSAALASQLAVAAGDTFGLQIGEGENAGRIRIASDKNGRRLSKLGGKALCIAFGAIDAFAIFGLQDKQFCKAEAVTGGGIQITLPKWKEGGSSASSGDAHSFSFDLDPEQAESLRDAASDADQEVPDYLAEIVGTYIEEYRKEQAGKD